jgi:signal transduction histidine kinase
MTPKDAGVLVNIIGFITGAALYAMLLAMVLRSLRTAHDTRPTSDLRRLSLAEDLLPLATAILGLFWNVGALALYGLRDLGVGELPPALTAAAFTALGFLPAVVVHSAIRNRQAPDERKRALWLVVGPYALSFVASVLHFHSAIFDQTAPSRRAMLLLTLSFGALIVPLLVLTRRQPDRSQVLWVVALSVFAVSALHLSHHEGDQYSWPVELIGHHSSLPLALAILYQDYRFAFADIFLKRALSLVALVSLAFGLYQGVAGPLFSRSQTGHFEPLAVGVLLGLWVATALAYPVLRRAVGSFVDRVVLRRPNYDALRAQISGLVAAEEDTATILDGVSSCLAPALSSRHTTWVRWDETIASLEDTTEALRAQLVGAFPQNLHSNKVPYVALGQGGGVDHIVITSPRNTGAIVITPTAEPPRYVLVIGELSGGRRLMSDDLAMLEAVAFITARRIDALRITHERCEQSLREQEIGKLATEAELRALRSQINPHFLFNALTTIGYLIQTAPVRALGTLMRLTELLRRVLRSGGEFVTLSEEIALIESYLEIEQARFEERLRTSVQVPASLCSIRIPPLLIQPLVENAILHGIAPSRLGGEVLIAARIEDVTTEQSDRLQLLCITVRDTGAGVSEIQMAHGRKRGLGLGNVEQRLKCYYGASARLSIESVPGAGTKVEAWLPVSIAAAGEELLSANTSQRRRA